MLALRVMCGMGAWSLWCVALAAATGLALVALCHSHALWAGWVVHGQKLRFKGMMYLASEVRFVSMALLAEWCSVESGFPEAHSAGQRMVSSFSWRRLCPAS